MARFRHPSCFLVRNKLKGKGGQGRSRERTSEATKLPPPHPTPPPEQKGAQQGWPHRSHDWLHFLLQSGISKSIQSVHACIQGLQPAEQSAVPPLLGRRLWVGAGWGASRSRGQPGTALRGQRPGSPAAFPVGGHYLISSDVMIARRSAVTQSPNNEHRATQEKGKAPGGSAVSPK